MSDKNICGLDVAVDDAPQVSGREGIRNFYAYIQDSFDSKGLAADQMLQRLAFQQLHDDKWPAIEFSNIMNGANIRVIQRRGRPGFALKALQSLRVGWGIFGQEFKRDTAVQSRILGAIDHTHTSAT